MINSQTLASSAVFTAIDFEGSGASPSHPDKPVQVGMTILNGGVITRHVESYLRIDHEVTAEAYRVHRIDRAKCEGAPSLLSFWPVINEAFQRTAIVAHNAGTEKRYIQDAFPLFNVKGGLWVDTLKLARFAWPHIEGHSLEDLVCGIGKEAEVRGLFPDRSWHDAAFDAAGSLVVLRHLLSLPAWKDVTVAQLVKAHPAEWHRGQVAKRRRPVRVKA